MKENLSETSAKPGAPVSDPARTLVFFPQFALLGTLVLGLLNSGCLVISSNHVSKPVAAKETVELRHDQNAGESTGWYTHHVHSSGVDYDITVRNNVERFQVGFLFWVIPIPYSESSVPDAEIQADLRPMDSNVTFDPWRIEYTPTNGIAIAPVKIWRRDNGSWNELSHGQVSINKPESFRLQYNAPCDPDLPFTVAIRGISTSNQTNLTTNIGYERAKLFHTGFRLPY